MTSHVREPTCLANRRVRAVTLAVKMVVAIRLLINAALRATIARQAVEGPEDKPLTVAVLRKVIREELLQ